VRNPGVLISAAVLVGLAAGPAGPAAASPVLSEEMRIFSELDEVLPPSGPVLLVFFSIDCAVCWDDLFEMSYFCAKNGLDIPVAGIAAAGGDALRDFLGKFGFRLPVVADPRRRIFRRYNVLMDPYKIILRDGRVVYRDDPYRSFFERREAAKQWLKTIASR
jgi:peroxiredoxin